MSDVEQRVVEIVKDYWKLASVQTVQITDRMPKFFRGALYEVTILDAVGEEHHNYVYVVGDDATRYDDLTRLSAEVWQAPNISETLRRAFESAGVAGIIAVLIAITVCGLAILEPGSKTPELWAAFNIILGFYFGTQARKDGQRAH